MNVATAKVLAPLLVAALAGCAAHKTTIQTRGGTATVTTSQDGKNVTVQTSEGTMSIGQGVSAMTLGVPLYPGAQAGQPAGITTATSTGSTTIANFTTSDAFEHVYGYYKRWLPAASEKMNVTSANGSVASFQVGGQGSPNTVTVQLSSDKANVTNILITRTADSRR